MNGTPNSANGGDNQPKTVWWITAMPWLINGAMLFLVCLPFAILLNKLDGNGIIGVFIKWALLSGIWLVAYVAAGLKFVPQNNFWVIERFDQFVGVRNQGATLLCLPNIIDKLKMPPERARHSYAEQELNLFEGSDKEQEIDFKDGSAPIEASIWFRIANPSLFAYAAINPIERLEQLVDDYLRPLLQKLKIDEANTSMKTIVAGFQRHIKADGSPDDTQEETDFYAELSAIGIELRAKKPLVVGDIRLPDSIKKLRDKVLEADKTRQAAALTGQGYAEAINAIREKSRPVDADGKPNGDPTISFPDARDIYMTLQGMEIFKNLPPGSSINLIGGTVEELIRNFTQGKKKGPRS